jgi:hypothetical protein
MVKVNSFTWDRLDLPVGDLRVIFVRFSAWVAKITGLFQ